MSDYSISDETLKFSFMVIDLYKRLTEIREYILSKQILRSGTSIWANVKEWEYWFTKKDFAYKMWIALKEAIETEYRLTLLQYWKFIQDNTQTKKLFSKNKEIIKVLMKIVKTTKENIQKDCY